MIIGSRGSALALAQSEEVKQALETINDTLNVQIQVISTKGDRILDRPLGAIGSKGLFTMEIEKELREHTIDLAVHSLKDMPSELGEDLVLTGTIACNDARDCIVFSDKYHSMEELPAGAVVGTGSARRKAQLLAMRPDLDIRDIRGNILTRLQKLDDGQYDAIVMAVAGLNRMNLTHRIGKVFTYEEMIPACGQGILAIEVHKDCEYLPLIERIVDPLTTKRMQYERLFLETVNGSCHLPVACHVE